MQNVTVTLLTLITQAIVWQRVPFNWTGAVHKHRHIHRNSLATISQLGISYQSREHFDMSHSLKLQCIKHKFPLLSPT